MIEPFYVVNRPSVHRGLYGQGQPILGQMCRFDFGHQYMTQIKVLI